MSAVSHSEPQQPQLLLLLPLADGLATFAPPGPGPPPPPYPRARRPGKHTGNDWRQSRFEPNPLPFCSRRCKRYPQTYRRCQCQQQPTPEAAALPTDLQHLALQLLCLLRLAQLPQRGCQVGLSCQRGWFSASPIHHAVQAVNQPSAPQVQPGPAQHCRSAQSS